MLEDNNKTVLEECNEAFLKENNKINLKENDKTLSFKYHLALNDLESLQSSVRELKARQVHILLAGIPIFLALLGPAIALIIFPDNPGQKYQYSLYFLPIMIFLLSSAFLSVFFQKATSIRRQEAYILLLQRYCANGVFPKGYYGWNDTYAKYNQRVRDKNEINLDNNLTNQLSVQNIAPSGAFPFLVGLVFGTIPMFSLIITIIVSLVMFDPKENMFNMFILPTSIIIPSIIVMARYYGIYKYVQRATNGKKSFRYFVYAFEKILDEPKHYRPDLKY